MKPSLFALIILVAQTFAQGPPPAPAVFTDSILGFRFTPPPNLRDLTKPDKRSIQERVAEMNKGNTINLLLSLRSGPDDTAPEWHTIAIQSYPRTKVGSDSSDFDACATFSRWVAGAGVLTGPFADVQIDYSHFVVSTFELKEGQLTRQARVYTTVLKGQVLSFAFSANSSDVLKRIESSMKSFRHEQTKEK